MQSQCDQTETESWKEIEPLLESAMAQLGEQDHNALLLRFYENRSFKDVSSTLGTTEAAAKMRVSRALEKLRAFFTKRGLAFSTSVIATALSVHSVQAAPAGLANSVTLAALHGTTVTTSTLTLIETTLKFMAWTKIKTAVVVGAIALAAIGTGTVALQHTKMTAANLKLAGYATPEASVQSMIWAASRGDFNTFLQACTPAQIDRFESKMAGKSEQEISQQAKAWANALLDYKITQKEVISDNEVHLHIHATPSAEGLHSGKVVIVMRKVGDTWKQEGDL